MCPRGHKKLPQDLVNSSSLIGEKDESKIALVDFVQSTAQIGCTEFVSPGRQIEENVESIQQIG